MVIDDEECRLAVLQDLFTRKITSQTAAEKFATISLREDVETSVVQLWVLLVNTALDGPGHHDKLVDVLADLSNLPDAQAADQPILIHNMQVWRDLPMLGWHFRDQWNGPSVPSSPPDRRQRAISKFINLNRFAALLMATDEPVFDYAWFALVTLRMALETPLADSSPRDSPDATVPAAAAWIEILGVEIYEWEEVFGRAGAGGPLWKGVSGFCEGRWKLWRERFGELARTETGLGDEARTAAKDAEAMMREIENGDVLD